MICHVPQCYGFVTYVVYQENVYLLCCTACAGNARGLGARTRHLEKRVS